MNRGDRFGMMALLGVSLILNLFLAQALRGERAEVERLREGLSNIKNAARLKVGEKVPPIDGEDSRGLKTRITYKAVGRPTLLYVFSSSCGWCKKNVDNIRALGKALSKDHRVVGVSLKEVAMEERRAAIDVLGFPVVFNLSPESIESYKLGGTPQTILISADGTIIKNWTGAYSNKLEVEIESFFGLELPGLLGL